MIRKSPLPLLAILGIWASLGADTIKLDLDSWLTAAVPHHPALKASEAEVQARLLRAEERLVWEDPELRLGADERPGLRDEEFLAIRLRIPHPWEEKALSERELVRLDIARAEKEAAVRLAREDLGRLYLEAVTAEQLNRLARERVSGMQSEVDRARQMLEKKRFTRTDLVRMQTELADAVADLSELESGLAAARLRMLEYLPDAGPGTQIVLAPVTLRFERDPPTPEAVHRSILKTDPELAARLAAIRAANAAVAAERARRIPFPTFVEGRWTRDRFRDWDEWEARAGISIPLFSWVRDTDPRERAELLLAQVDAELRREEIAQLSSRLCQRYFSTSGQLATFEDTHQPVIEELETILSDLRLEPRPDTRLDLIDDRFRLQRDLLRARLQYEISTWALHVLLLNWSSPPTPAES